MRAEKVSEKKQKLDADGYVESLRYRNPELPIDDRVSDLLGRMTIDDKVGQMICIWGQEKKMFLDEEGRISPEKLRQNLKDGIGQIARLSDTAGGLTATETAELANALQRFFVEETRLGIPVIFHEECLHGLAAKDATSYPQPIGLASTFDTELVKNIFCTIAEEARSRGVHQALTPVLDVAREPRWGRVEETFGEDPYLITQMGIAVVKGLQGEGELDDKKHIIATLKHFAAHGQPESGSNCGPVNVSERILRDVLLPPFREAVTNGKVKSIMASYNEIDGVPSHANKWLLTDVLRKEWGFDGTIVSDYYAITELDRKENTQSHGVARNKREAAFLAADAGVNIELPDPDCYPHLADLVREERFQEKKLDDLVTPILRQKFELGLFDDPYVDVEKAENSDRLEKGRELALQAARETITLLKNAKGILPLDLNKYKRMAVIGPNADRKLLGGYSGQPKYYTTVLQGIKDRVGPDADVMYSEGCKITVGGGWNEDSVVLPDSEEDRKSIARAVEVAKKSDVVILVIGDNEQTSREAWSKTHLGDRADLNLLGMQDDLVRAVVEAGKPTVVVLFNGRPMSIGYISTHVDAMFECWYLGQEAGRAVADVLFGDWNPSGRLPISIPRSVGHIPSYYNYKPSARRGYLFDDITPLYPFGFGLSYTTFEFSNLRLENPVIQKHESTEAMVDVKNTGNRRGDEVVQMYIHDVVSTVTRPVKELRGFKRVRLEPGETKTVRLRIDPEHLAYTDINMIYAVDEGEFEIMVGSSSRDEDLLRTILKVI